MNNGCCSNMFKQFIRNPDTSALETQRFQTHARHSPNTQHDDTAWQGMPQCLHKYEMKPATSNEEVVCKPAHHPTYSGNRRLLDK